VRLDTYLKREGPEKITLYFKQGSSDKVYQAQLICEQDNYNFELRWKVLAAYGRRGSSMRHIDKTPSNMEYASAKKVFDQLVQSKLRKGYVIGPGGTSFNFKPIQHAAQVQTGTGWLPQLLNQVTYEEACGVFRANEGNIWLQTKWDGERRGVLTTVTGQTTMHHKIIGANRKGFEVPLSDPIRLAVDKLCTATSSLLTFDSEDMGDYLTIFDIMKFGRQDLIDHTFTNRVPYLQELFEALSEIESPFLSIDMPYRPKSFIEFGNFIEDAKDRNEEGVVIRVGSTKYLPGKPNSGGGLYKLKFKESATCRVEFKHPSKSSVGLELKDDTTNEWVSVGNTTIYPNQLFPDEGDIVEVEYLYAYPGGSLYQPVFKGPRTDVGVEAAVISQLKYKKGT